MVQVNLQPPDFLTANSALSFSNPMSRSTFRSEGAMVLGAVDANDGDDGGLKQTSR